MIVNNLTDLRSALAKEIGLKSLSQTQSREYFNISHAHWNRVENGVTKISDNLVDKINMTLKLKGVDINFVPEKN